MADNQTHLQSCKKNLLFLGSGIILGYFLKKMIKRILSNKKSSYQSIKDKLDNITPNNISEANIMEGRNHNSIKTDTEDYKETVKEQLARTGQYFGLENLVNIEQARIIIIGLGGVGSHLAAQLIRAGVVNIKLVDFDLVTLSSLNRHAFALRRDVGISKVDCIVNYAKQIFPHSKMEGVCKMFSKESAEKLITFGNDNLGNPIPIGKLLFL